MIFFTITPEDDFSFTHRNKSVKRTYISALLKPENNVEFSYTNELALVSVLNVLSKHNYDDIEPACRIIDKALSSMFKDINSDMYGIFPYNHFQTPDCFIMPDYDFQSKILATLLQIYFEYMDILPEETTNNIKNACLTTAFTLSYTQVNIDAHNVILEILNLICIGETFNRPEIMNAGMHRLHSLVYLTLYNDCLMEYNHPERIIVSLEGINYFKNHIKNPDFHSAIQSIEHIILNCFYSHFNPKLMQWSGPFSIKHPKDFLTDEYSLKRIKKIINQENLQNIKVPEEFYNLSPVSGNKFMQILTSRGFTYPHFKLNLVASSYNTNTFSLGSFNHDDLWSGRKPCIGFFGNSHNIYSLRVQCLLDNYDFACGAFHSVQYKGSLIGHIDFSTNRGYKSIATDYSKKYKMTDLRIRFCIEGDTSHLEHAKKNNTLTVLYKQLSIVFRIEYAVFDDKKIDYELTTSGKSIFCDIILYRGEEIYLELEKINKAIIAFSLFMGTNKNYKIPEVKTYENEEMLVSECHLKDFPIKLETPVKPSPIEHIFLYDRQYINNMRIEQYADRAKMLLGQHRFITQNNISQSQIVSLEENNENKSFLKKINNLDKQSFEKISASLGKILNELNNYSFTIIQRYSVHILIKLFNAAKKCDIRFENIIEKKYSQVYDKISYATKFSQIRTILTDTAAKLEAEYKKLKQDTKKSQNIKKIIDIINAEYKNPNLSLQMIADEIGQSEAHLSREFHTTIGQSYSNYLLKVRIEKAKTLLEKGINTEDVMKQCGYVNFHTFNAAFKRYTGTTSRKYLS